MHEDYAREQFMLVRNLADLMDQIPSVLEEACKADYTSLYSEAKAIFTEHYLPRLPYIGGTKNPHTKQLAFAAAFAAIHDVMLQHGANQEQVCQACLLAEERYYARFDKNVDSRLGKRLRSFFGTQKLKNDLAESTRFISKSKDSWVYKHSNKNPKAKHQFSIINCGVANFCKANGLTDLLPVLCQMDFAHFERTGLNCTMSCCMGKGDEDCIILIND